MKAGKFGMLCGASCLLTTTAFGHPGHAGWGVAAGLAHPLSGMDHLVTMLAVGVWAAQAGGRRGWMIPAAFVLSMIVGVGLAMGGAVMAGSAVDQAIMAGLVVLGLIIAGTFRMPVLVGAGLAGVFAVFHGYAHGMEMQSGASMAGFGIGFICTTVCLMGLGMAGARLMARTRAPVAVRAAGAAVAIVAILMLGGVL